MGDYHEDHYLKKDVLLLAVFENFIDTCLIFYRLDPCHYFSSPGLSWDAMLKTAGVKLEKIFDIDMYWFIEKGLIGGISYIAKRYSEANNKCMKNYDPAKPSIYIYLDVNNLHDWAVSDNLPYGRFKWLKNVDNFDVNPVSENSFNRIYYRSWSWISWRITGITWLSISSKKLAIIYGILSDYCKKIADKYGIKVGDVMKLIPIWVIKLITCFLTEIFSCTCL